MTANTDILCAHAYISGIVQGVNFRFYTQQKAQALGLTGWVRNLEDGQVEIIFEGSSEAVHKMMAWCYNGPRSSRVDKVDVEYQEPSGTLHGFHIRNV